MPLWKVNLFLRMYGLRFIPLVWFCRPYIREINDRKAVLEIPLRRRTKNHLNAMYFGALNVGAELSIAMAAVLQIEKSGHKVDFLFKDYKVSFLKRAEADVHFVFENVADVVNQINETIRTGERINQTLRGYAIVPSKSLEHVAEYELTLSVKKRPPKN